MTKADKYVRAITSLNGVIYIGGDFDTWNGTARSHVVAIDTSFNMTSWNPGADGEVRALATDGSTIYIAGATGSSRRSTRPLAPWCGRSRQRRQRARPAGDERRSLCRRVV